MAPLTHLLSDRLLGEAAVLAAGTLPYLRMLFTDGLQAPSCRPFRVLRFPLHPGRIRIVRPESRWGAVTELVLYDCDNTMGLPRREIGDGLALLYLLGRPDIELLAVTTTFGNGSVDQTYEQTRQMLRDLGRTDVRVVFGANRRGQGSTEASHFMVQTVAAHPGEVTVLATGPLSNLGDAAEIDPRFFSRLKRIICWGGQLEALRVGWRDLPERNLSADPEAAYAVLRASCPVTLIAEHLGLQAPFSWQELKALPAWRPETRRVVRNWLLAFAVTHGVREFYLWDLLPALCLTHPMLFDDAEAIVASRVSDLARGRLVLGTGHSGARIHMPEQLLYPDAFRKLLFETWARVNG